MVKTSCFQRRGSRFWSGSTWGSQTNKKAATTPCELNKAFSSVAFGWSTGSSRGQMQLAISHLTGQGLWCDAIHGEATCRMSPSTQHRNGPSGVTLPHPVLGETAGAPTPRRAPACTPRDHELPPAQGAVLSPQQGQTRTHPPAPLSTPALNSCPRSLPPDPQPPAAALCLGQTHCASHDTCLIVHASSISETR